MLNPIVEKVEQANPSVTFYSVNTDDQPDIAQHFGVTNIPAMFVVKDGKVVESIIGFKPFNDINTVVGKYV
jgi:thioredoxin 1